MPKASYSQIQTKKSNSSFYYALRFMPGRKREAIYSVYTFCRHIDDAVDEARDLRTAEGNVARWREEVHSLYRGHPTHPVSQDLAATIQEFPIPEEYLQEVINGVEMDLRIRRYSTFEDLLPYCHRVASIVGLICIEIFGYGSEKAKEFAKDLGIALQLTNILRDVGDDADKNRIYLPLEDLRRFDVSESHILRKEFSPQVRELFRSQYERALTFYRRAAECAQEIADPRLFPAQIMGTIYRRILERIAQEDFLVFSQHITIPRWQKLGIAFRGWIASRYLPSLLWRNAY